MRVIIEEAAGQAPSVLPGADAYAVGAFIAYLLLIVGIGVYASRFSSAGISEFFVGGRRMHHFVVALSAVVSGRSAWLLLGVTGMAYAMGPSAVWAVAGYILVELFLFLYYAPRLRRFSGRYDCITIPDFYAARFEDERGTLRMVLVSVILLFIVGYVAAQFVAGGKALAAGFGLTPTAGVFLTAGIVLVYTMLGGFLAVSLTDVVQACFMLLALVLLPVIAIADRGGLDIVIDQLRGLDPSLVDPFALSAGAAIGFLGIGLGSPGNPHILARYMSISDPQQLRYAAVVGTAWNVAMGWGALFVGLTGRVYFPDVAMLPEGDTENLLPLLAQQHLHPILFGVVMAAIFAAIMSTADSQLLVATSAVVRDVYEKIVRRNERVPQRRLVFISRVVVVLLVTVAVVFGLLAQQLVFWLVLFAWAGLGASLGPTSLLALFWRRATRTGMISGIVTGTAVTVIWYFVPALKSRVYELVPAFILAAVVTVIVSLITRPPADSRVLHAAMTARRSTSAGAP